jgi:hypothetical protein
LIPRNVKRYKRGAAQSEDVINRVKLQKLIHHIQKKINATQEIDTSHMFQLESINFNKEYFIKIIYGARYNGNDFGFKKMGNLRKTTMNIR